MDYGLIGGKLGHSYSKEIHESLADYKYELCPLTDEEFDPFMKAREFKAINVTIPYKQRVIPFLDSLDERAKRIGAVNTIVNNDGKLKGYNTDYSGFKYTLKKHGINPANKKVLLIGNGGAAQAVKACLWDEGVSQIVIVRRSEDDEAVTYEDVFLHHTDVEIIVNTSPVGMYPDTDASPLDLREFKSCEAVVDLIYNPIETMLTAQAKKLGMNGVTGLEMLIAQAKYAVEIFLNNSIPEERIDEMYRDMVNKL